MDHDAAHKRFYALPDVLADLVHLVAPELADELVFSRAAKLSPEYVGADLARRTGDLVWKVPFRKGRLDDGSRVYLLVVLEFQSSLDGTMAKRLREYADLLLDGLRRDGTAARQGGLPPLLPIVVFNGARRWTAPGQAKDWVEMPSERVARALAPYQPQAYVFLDTCSEAADSWPADNRVSATARLQRSGSETELLATLTAEMKRFGGTRNEALRRALHAWASALWSELTAGGSELPAFEELEGGDDMTTLLEARAKEWTARWFEDGRVQGIEQGRAQGIEEGVERGRAEEARRLLGRLAARKFDVATAERLSRLLTRRSAAALARAGEWIIECDSGTELLARVRADGRGNSEVPG